MLTVQKVFVDQNGLFSRIDAPSSTASVSKIAEEKNVFNIHIFVLGYTGISKKKKNYLMLSR